MTAVRRSVRVSSALMVAASVLSIAAAARAETIPVPAGGNLQVAINAAAAGDVIALQPGATYVGNFVLTNKGGAAPIVIETWGEGLPAAGSRVGPAQSGTLAKLQSPNSEPALRTAAGAHGWQIVLLEFVANAGGLGDIIELGALDASQADLSTVPYDLTVDRCYIHGAAGVPQKRAISLNSASTTITGSYIAEIKAIGQDSQAIFGANGPGPYTITNNYLEAAGENIMFGGADPVIRNLVPADIEIAYNTVAKQPAWMSQGWQVKNLLELKNARRVNIHDNTFAYNWAAAQNGFAILFTVRNQDGGCPWCQVDTVAFERNVVQHSGAAVEILGYDNDNASQQTRGITVRNNLFADIDAERWGGNGNFLQITDGPADVIIDHNTIIQGSALDLVFAAGPPIAGFRFTNNIARHDAFGIIGDAHGVGFDSIAAYFPGAIVTANVMADGPSSVYPGGNLFPAFAQFQAQFADYTGGDYRLTAASSWRNAGTDGQDLGANLGAASSPAPQPNGDPRAGDFDGDGRTDVTVYRPSTGTWFTLQSSSGFSTWTASRWGISGDIPVPGDYDGDGSNDLAVYRPAEGYWYIQLTGTTSTIALRWGLQDDVPVPGDYDGDGITDVAVFRPSSGEWWILTSSSGFTGCYRRVWGVPSPGARFMPVPADYDGDHRTDIAVWQPSTGIWWVLTSSSGFESYVGSAWGAPGDVPVPGDYDGDGKTDPAVWRPSTGVWYVLRSSTTYGSSTVVEWGVAGDMPVPGDYDGDGQTDLAVFRASTNTWFILGSSTSFASSTSVVWGFAGDIAVEP